MEKDPIGFAGGTTGLYEYCYGAPVGLVDVTGAKPYDRFASPEEAAIDAVQEYLPFTRDNGVEVAGLIFQDPLGHYFYIDPEIGSKHQSQALRQRAKVGCGAIPVADYHTHPYSDPLPRKVWFLADEEPPAGVGFSGKGGDLDAYRERAALFGRPDYVGYMGAAEGSFHAYDVATGRAFSVSLP